LICSSPHERIPNWDEKLASALAWETQMDWVRSPVWRWERFAALSLNLLLWVDIVRFVSLVAHART
jgi:hypothetical protein